MGDTATAPDRHDDRRDDRRDDRHDDRRGELPAGRFSAWLASAQAAIDGDAASEVPCGSCRACCESSQFVHVEPDEADALAHIPHQLLFPAPGRPRGNVLMGYDDHGRCPMLTEAGCSIYAHRPRACRAYDCRVLAAAAVEVDPPQARIGRQVARWRFDLDDDVDRRLAESVRAAAEKLAAGGPRSPTQRAVAAVRTVGLTTRLTTPPGT